MKIWCQTHDDNKLNIFRLWVCWLLYFHYFLTFYKQNIWWPEILWCASLSTRFIYIIEANNLPSWHCNNTQYSLKKGRHWLFVNFFLKLLTVEISSLKIFRVIQSSSGFSCLFFRHPQAKLNNMQILPEVCAGFTRCCWHY